MTFLNRASVEIGETRGRTLSGIAMPWDKVARVRDVVGGRSSAPYLEAFAPSSTDKTRAEHTTFPFFAGHDVRTEPIGAVKFSRSAEALMFDATASETPRGNDYLQLAKDDAMGSVSIQFRPVKAASRSFPGVPGTVTYRTEVGLRHLALAPTGYGQYEDARVLAIRSDVTFDALTDAVKDAIERSIGSQGLPDDPYVRIVDITDSWAVYEVEGGPHDEANTKRVLFRVEYLVAETGEVALSDAVAVVADYVPTGRMATTSDLELTRAERAWYSRVAASRRVRSVDLDAMLGEHARALPAPHAPIAIAPKPDDWKVAWNSVLTAAQRQAQVKISGDLQAAHAAFAKKFAAAPTKYGWDQHAGHFVSSPGTPVAG